MSAKPRVGISSCLLGENVRYDGTNKRVALWNLGEIFEWVPVCPEVEIGLGVPREPIELVRDGDEVRLLGVSSEADHTESMRTFADRRLERLAALGLHGYIFKARSPSCGPDAVPVAGSEEKRAGMFAEAVLARLPGLPVAHEEHLAQPAARRRFAARVLAYHGSTAAGHPGK